MDEFKVIAAFIAAVVILGFGGDFLQARSEKRKTAKFLRVEFEKWRVSISNDIHYIHKQFKELDDLYDFDRSAFHGEEGQDAVDLIREKLDDLYLSIDRMSGCARTHEEFAMTSDATYVHAALRSAMRHYNREK